MEGRPIRPPTELTFRMSPSFCLRKTGTIARMTFMTPNTLTSKLLWMLSGEIVSKIPYCPYPALLITASSLPKRWIELLIAWSMLAGSVTSRRVTSTLARPARSRAAETSRMVATTFQPFSANSLAVAWPNPVDEPVISTVFLFMLVLLPSANSRSERSDHDPVERAILQRCVPLIHVTQRNPSRNQIIQIDPTLQIELGVHGDIPLEVRGAEVDALDALLPADGVKDVQVEADLGFGYSDEIKSAADAQHGEPLLGDLL